MDLISQEEVAFLINTPKGNESRGDGVLLRSEAVMRGIDLVSTLSGASALVQSLMLTRNHTFDSYCLQDLLAELA